MRRGQFAVLVAFAAIVAGIAVFVLPKLLEPRRAPQPVWESVPDPTAPGARPSSVTSEPGSPSSGVPPSSRPLDVSVRLVDESGAPISEGDAALVWHGGARLEGAPGVVVRRTAASTWVRRRQGLWAPVAPASGSAQTAQTTVTLRRAGPEIAMSVVEDDGTPAADVPVLWPGPDGKPLARRTGARGDVTIDDQPAGLLIVSVGGTERAGPTLRLRVGVDKEARATLDPPLVVTGRVRDAGGAGVAGARVFGLVPGGRAGREVETAADGGFSWRGRATDRLVLVAASRDDARWTAGKPAWPDPRGPLSATVELTLPTADASIEGELASRSASPGFLWLLRVEPAALALAREAFGDGAIAYEPRVSQVSMSTPRSDDALTISVRGLGFDGPVRVQVFGDAVPEDHLLSAAASGRRSLRLAPRPAAPAPSTAPSGDATLVGTIAGRVRDGQGVPLTGVTVMAGAARATSDRDGCFTLTGLEPGSRVDLLYGFLDGADAGSVDPAPFAPWFSSAARAMSAPAAPAAPAAGSGASMGTPSQPTPAAPAPAAEPLELVLPRAASVTFRAVNGLDGKPLSWVRALILDGAGEPRFDDVVATRDGRVRLDGLVAGTRGSLLLFAPDLRREVPLALLAGETVDAGEVSLARGARVDVDVSGPGGVPVVGAVVAEIEIGRGETGGRALARERDLFLRRATTGKEGHAILDGLDPKRLDPSFAIYAPGYAPQVAHASLTADAAGALHGQFGVVLSRGLTLRVRVEDKTGKRLAGAAVELRDARDQRDPRGGARWLELVRAAGVGGVIGTPDDLRLVTSSLMTEDPAQPGTHRVAAVEPGPYDVFALLPGYKPARARTTVVENPFAQPLDAMDLRLVMEPETAGGK